MSINLKVTPAEVISVSGEIESLISSLRQNLDEADRAVRSCPHFWEGEASRRHQSDYAAFKERADEAMGRIKEQPNKLLRMAGIYTDAEQANEETASVLTGGRGDGS